jgi:hypothetical protein
VVYANMPYAGTNTVCTGLPASPNGNLDIDAEISLSSHEQFEMVTDPWSAIQSNAYAAWQDPSGVQGENGDKCAWTFGPLRYNSGTANQYWNGHYYLVQQEWSNKAFFAGIGNQVVGCVQG